MPETLLLNVREAMVAFGRKPLFDGLEFSILDGDKIALVGKNGAGKTTLMNIITGERDLDDGERFQLEGTTIGYLQQDIVPKPDQTVRQFVREHIRADEEEEAVDYRIDAVLHPLDLDAEDQMDKLSGGQLRRACLARALIENPDILLLDEPTNHLDLDIIEWLENYLQGYRGALLVISHDRTFLANVTSKVFWLDRGRLRVCPYGFKDFEDWQTQLIEQEARELKNRQKWLEMEEEWASRGVPARRKRNQKRLETMRNERAKLKSDVSAYKRMIRTIEVDAPDVELSSKIVCEFRNVYKSFGDKKILEKFNLRILRGDRIGILGRNGSGKTTFLRMLVGELDPDAGTIRRQKDWQLSYFDQKRKELKPDVSMWRTLAPHGDYIDVMGKHRHVIGYLKDFMFDADDAQQKVGLLSGGQKNRLMLAKVLAAPGTLLILDEPTNDLDMETLDMLEDILSAYNGTLLVVSHDRDFLDQTVSKVIAFEGDSKVDMCVGGYTDYLEHKGKAFKKPDKKNPHPGPLPYKGEGGTRDKREGEGKAPAKKLTFKLQHELDKLPEKIAGFEAEIAEYTAKLQDSEFYMKDKDGFAQAVRYLERARKNLDEATARWLELEDMQKQA